MRLPNDQQEPLGVMGRASVRETWNNSFRGQTDWQRDRLDRRLDEPPRMRLFENLHSELCVERMACAMRDEMPDDWIADEGQIANRIENLVANELVFETQRVVENTCLTEHHRIFERSAKRKPVLPQHLDVFQERHRASRRDVVDERLFRDAQRPGLMTQKRVIVADAVGDLEMIRWIERDALVSTRDRKRPDDFEVLSGSREWPHAGFVNQVNERGRAAVHNRNFGGIQLDNYIVDFHADERRQQVFDRLDRDLLARQARRELDACQMMNSGRNLVIAKIGTPEANTEGSRGGVQDR